MQDNKRGEIDMDKQHLLDLDSESICFECAGKFILKRLGPGVSLCFWCRLKELFLDFRYRNKV